MAGLELMILLRTILAGRASPTLSRDMRPPLMLCVDFQFPGRLREIECGPSFRMKNGSEPPFWNLCRHGSTVFRNRRTCTLT